MMNNYDSIKARLNKLSSQRKKLLAEKLSAVLNSDTNPILTTKRNDRLIACIKGDLSCKKELAQLKHFVQAQLPQHYVPQSFYSVVNFPLKDGGKIDRASLSRYQWQFKIDPDAVSYSNSSDFGNGDIDNNVSASDIDDSDQDAFSLDEVVAPRNQTEQVLATVWSEVLEIGEISVHDNFLEVGGDSLLSIRIIARANKAGLSISPQDFFEFPTIAEQAKRVKKADATTVIKEGKVEGLFNITPIQQWFFDRINTEQHHWNQSVSLSVDETLNFGSLERAIQQLLIHHDVLRSVFVRNSHRWHQEIRSFQSELPVKQVDFSSVAAKQLDAELEVMAQELNQSLCLESGSLIQFLFVKTAPGMANRLVIIMHHLIVDAESWHILLNDLEQTWTGYTRGETTELAPKTHSFKLWSDYLSEFSHSPTGIKQLPFWQSQINETVAAIPTDFSATPIENTEQSSRLFSQLFDKYDTSLLLHTMPKVILLDAKEGLLTALVSAIAAWTNNESVLLDVEGHGREALFENVDISRTMGWFTSVYPVMFKEIDSKELNNTSLVMAKKVKQALNKIPDNGIGYGILRELLRDPVLRGQAVAQICFNYLGQIDKLSGHAAKGSKQEENSLIMLNDNIGIPRSLTGHRAYLIEINAMIVMGQLKVRWSYSDNFHTADTISRLAQQFAQVLSSLIRTASNHMRVEEVSDGDFDLANLDNGELIAISNILSQADESP